MKRKSKVINFNKIASEAGEFTQNILGDTQDFVKGVSKEIARIDWQGMSKSAQKSIRSRVKSGNKTLNRSLKKFRKTNAHRTLTRTIPRYAAKVSIWSTLQFRKLQNVATRRFHRSRKYMIKKTPLVKSFVKEYYPRVESFVLNQVPAYRVIFTK